MSRHDMTPQVPDPWQMSRRDMTFGSAGEKIAPRAARAAIDSMLVNHTACRAQSRTRQHSHRYSTLRDLHTSPLR
eukprot:1820256-Prymnesium_polylepis.2